jgi:hypothetical protein
MGVIEFVKAVCSKFAGFHTMAGREFAKAVYSEFAGFHTMRGEKFATAVCSLFAGFHTMGGDEAMEEFDICMGANLTCMNDHLNRMGKQEILNKIFKLIFCSKL